MDSTKPFRGPRLKIERAERHRQELDDILVEIARRNPTEGYHERDHKTGENVYRVRIFEPPPNELSTIIGDIVHNLRSALDVLVCELVLADKGQIRRQSGFPIDRSEKKFVKSAHEKLKGLNPKASRLVHRLKPFRGGNNCLWQLHELDIVDKHRAIVPVVAANVSTVAQLSPKIRMAQGVMTMKPADLKPERSVFPLKDGMEVYRTSPNYFDEHVDIYISYAFGNGTDSAGNPISPTLADFSRTVRRIVAIFERHCDL